MHTNSDARWDQVRELSPFILEMLPYKHNDETRDVPDPYDEYEDPIHIMSSKVFNSMATYQNHYFVAPDLDYLSRPIPSLKKTNFLF
jgi:hypothetical protein